MNALFLCGGNIVRRKGEGAYNVVRVVPVVCGKSNSGVVRPNYLIPGLIFIVAGSY
ncbi:hypothetical protein JCM6292_3497 [Bacteroides pyogenes JCM 6292]|uniref:Uncharacterized protein n=1 Tax=Bacteroides pyogenes JCM 6292 TaxID=1235809 RepID=W4PB74_9BACE|nr:hypothetical protein JCM6292_3497 [Bacteroides pyogenes JCM 6292]